MEKPKWVEPRQKVFTVFLEHPLTSNNCYWGTQEGKYLTLRHLGIKAVDQEAANKEALRKGIKCEQCNTPYQIPE